MKFCSIILAIVFCLITVEGQNFHQRHTNNDVNKNVDIKHVKNKPERFRRNHKQSFYNNNQNYLNEFQNIGVEDFLKGILFSVREIETQLKQEGMNRYHPSYYDNRPSYSNKCEDTLKELLTVYKELASQLKNSHPAPPRIIYVLYPAPAITNKNTTTMPVEDEGDGSRPVSFKPKQPSSILKIPPPPFDHGSKQAGVRVDSNSQPTNQYFLKKNGYIPPTPRHYK